MSDKAKAQLAARRTPDIEEQLQQLWSLRPELMDKNKMTILLALAAFVRESKRTLSSSPPPGSDVAIGPEEAKTAGYVEATKDSNVSDDVEWD